MRECISLTNDLTDLSVYDTEPRPCENSAELLTLTTPMEMIIYQSE